MISTQQDNKTLNLDRYKAQRCLSLLDLTSLNEEDTQADIQSLCQKATSVHGHVAAVCLWPKFVSFAKETLKGTGVKVATVANFPQGGLDERKALSSVQEGLEAGADEIDFVFPYHAWQEGKEQEVRALLEKVVILCKQPPFSATVKIILETGELLEESLIKSASETALKADADFIKTSTGKTKICATLEATGIMLQALKEQQEETGRPVGLKPSGGLRSLSQAWDYIEQAERVLGEGWVSPKTFRFGASGLLLELWDVLEGQDISVKAQTQGPDSY